MDRLFQDLRYGVRTLLHRPGFTFVAVLTLALGIGANTAIFSVVNGVLLRSLPYRDPDRLAMLWEAQGARRNIHASYLNFVDWREQAEVFEQMSGCTGRWGGPSTISGGTEPDRAYVTGVLRDFFNVLGVAPAVGRVFLPEEYAPGTPPAVIVSYGFWQRRMGADADLSDKKLSIDGLVFNVVGVMPRGFDFPAGTDLWYSREQLSKDTSERSSHNYMVIGRLRAGVTLDEAQAEMNAIAARLESQYPKSNQGAGVAVLSLKDQMTGSIRLALIVMTIAVGLVLLIACANVANLLLARALARQREISIRTALGATRLQIIRQLLTESLLLSVAGGALGLLLAVWLVQSLILLSPGTIPRISEVTISTDVLLYAAGLAVLTSLMFGLVPALKISKPDLQQALKEGGRASSHAGGLMRNVLVVAQVALTLMLLVGAGLLVKSFWRLSEVNAGFDPESVLTMQVSLPSSDYQDDRRVIAFYRNLFARLESVAGIDAVGMVNNLPMGGVNINGQFEIEGRPKDKWGYSGFRIVSPGYFRAMNIPVIKGRTFTEQDDENATAVAVLSERAAKEAFPDEDAIGKRFRSGMDNRYEVWTTIIGIVGDVRHAGLEGNLSSDLYVPYAQRPGRAGDMTLVMRTKNDPAALISAARQEVASIDKNLPVTFETMNQVYAKSIAARLYNMTLLGVFASLAVVLSIIGIYSVMSYTVTENTREIGIRMALGAEARHVLKLVLGQGLVLTFIGILIGVAGAFALTWLMGSLLFGVTATDPLTFASVSVLFVVVALLACYIPARRATRVDPMVALRYE